MREEAQAGGVGWRLVPARSGELARYEVTPAGGLPVGVVAHHGWQAWSAWRYRSHADRVNPPGRRARYYVRVPAPGQPGATEYPTREAATAALLEAAARPPRRR
jgi:hypothetical protein